MNTAFVANPPCIFFKKERILAVGDLHIGYEAALVRDGIHVPGAEKGLGADILSAYNKTRAVRIVFLGDVKHSITYPDFMEYKLLGEFFRQFSGIEVHIAKGNHDSHLYYVLKKVGAEADIGNEIIINGIAFMHGTSLPSEQAMQCRYLVTAHAHPLVRIAGKQKRAWIVSKTGTGARKRYKKYNKDILLFVAPAANSLVGGREISPDMKKSSVLFRNGIFNLGNSKVYSTEGKLIGTVQKIAKHYTKHYM
jgi:metallophosphoesterase superfamily enzyme